MCIRDRPFVKINAPTVEMTFSVNDSPFAGKEGKYVTSRQIRDRLMRELLKDVALKVEDSATNDSFRVMGRGEMHLSILIETMRREGYELQVSPPHVLTHEENGKVMEPMERVVVDVPETYQGNVMTALGARKAILMNMQMMNSRSRIEFRMPSRGLFGYRSQFLTDTHGEGIMNTIFDGYEEWCGDIQTRSTGSLDVYKRQSQIGGEKAVIGSQHFVFEDEGCCIPTSECGKFDALPPEYSHLYLAIGGVLAGVICIADPLREEASEVLKQLRGLGTVSYTHLDVYKRQAASSARPAPHW